MVRESLLPAWLISWLPRAIGMAALILFLGTFVRNLSSPAVDFMAYYEGGLALRTGGDLYASARTIASNGYAMGAPNTPDGNASAYVYPPLIALAVAPLTLLPANSARLVWYLVLNLSVLLTAWLLTDLFSSSRTTRRTVVFGVVLIWLLLFKPVRGALGYTGQIDVVLMFLLVLTAWGMSHRRQFVAGVALGLAIAIKPFFVLLALYFLRKRALASFVTAGITASTLGLLPLLLFGYIIDYLVIGSYWGGPTFGASPVSQSFTSLLLRLFTETPFAHPLVNAPWLVLPLRTLYTLAVVGIVLVTVHAPGARGPVQVSLELGIIVVSMMLISPLAEESHLAYLAIGLVAVGAAAAMRLRERGVAIWLATAFLAVSAGLYAPGLHELSWGYWRFNIEPLRFPYSLVTGVYLYVQWIIAALLVATLAWWRRDPASRGDRGDVVSATAPTRYSPPAARA